MTVRGFSEERIRDRGVTERGKSEVGITERVTVQYQM
jgi:hypothetical protein